VNRSVPIYDLEFEFLYWFGALFASSHSRPSYVHPSPGIHDGHRMLTVLARSTVRVHPPFRGVFASCQWECEMPLPRDLFNLPWRMASFISAFPRTFSGCRTRNPTSNARSHLIKRYSERCQLGARAGSSPGGPRALRPTAQIKCLKRLWSRSRNMRKTEREGRDWHGVGRGTRRY
jgi:hypothetical protein